MMIMESYLYRFIFIVIYFNRVRRSTCGTPAPGGTLVMDVTVLRIDLSVVLTPQRIPSLQNAHVTVSVSLLN